MSEPGAPSDDVSPRWAAAAGAVAAWLLLGVLGSCAVPDRRFSFREENDLFSSGAGEDRDYSQGLQLRWEAESGGALARTGEVLLTPLAWLDPLGGGAGERDVRFVAEQRIYTPDDLDAVGFVEDQRPYAAFLTLGFQSRRVRLDPDPERRRDWLHVVGLAAGTTGEAALGEIGQRGTHYVLGEADPPGWPNQLDSEPVLQLDWDLRHRAGYGEVGPLEWDALVGGRAELGNAFTNLQSGFELRLGHALPRDRRPWAGEARPWSVWLSAGANARWALHDITLDGSLFDNADPRITLEREPLVAQWTFGLAAEYQGFTVAWRFLRQTKEYERELGYHDWGSIWVGYRYVF